MIKVIFSDMDGTLLDESGKLPAGFDEVAAELERRRVLFAPASGRQYYSLIESFPKYVNRFLFLAENGTTVCYKGEHIYESLMEDAVVHEVLAAADGIPHCFSVFCGRAYGYILEKNCDAYFLKNLRKYYRRTMRTPRFSEVQDRAVKLSFFDDEGRAEERIYPKLKPFSDRLQVVLASKEWVDVTNKDASKGTAIAEMQRKFGVTPKECAAFGDYMNDAEMMQAVYYSYAMENAYPAVKKLARFSAPSNAAHGVMQTIETFMKEGLI